MVVEFTHRVTSGLSLLLCTGVWLMSLRVAPKGSFLRKAGLATFVLILTEALIGAALVLLRLVESDQSVLRAVSMSVHFTNTFLLLGAVVLTARSAKLRNPVFKFRGNRETAFAASAVLMLILLGASGAVTALGDTLFPTSSVAQGLAQDLSSTRHFLIQLRLFHPLIAVLVSVYLVVFARWVARKHKDMPSAVFHATLLMTLQCAQLLLGVINVLLFAPIFVQLLHLLLADLIWVNLIMLLSGLFVTDEPLPV
jgi:heme A synthase